MRIKVFLILFILNYISCQLVSQEEIDNFFMNKALNEAKTGLEQGGIPIGSVLVVDNTIIGRGHNMRVQTGSPIQHAEMNALNKAGRLTADVYSKATLYTTLSPCPMCSGAASLYKINRIVIGDNVNFKSEYGEDLLKKMGKEVIVLNNKECINIMREFIKNNPTLWNEDIGVKDRINKHSEALCTNRLLANTKDSHVDIQLPKEKGFYTIYIFFACLITILMFLLKIYYRKTNVFHI